MATVVDTHMASMSLREILPVQQQEATGQNIAASGRRWGGARSAPSASLPIRTHSTRGELAYLPPRTFLLVDRAHLGHSLPHTILLLLPHTLLGRNSRVPQT